MASFTPISTTKAPSTGGRYAQAVNIGGFIHLAGFMGDSPEKGEIVATDAGAQTEQIVNNIEAVLLAGGSDLSKVYKRTMFLVSMSDLPAVNAVWKRRFGENASKQASSAVQISGLVKEGALVEIECIALA